MSQKSPCSSPWIDLTEAHKDLREELETTITDYVVEDKKGIKTHVIVAPFGSGKTTLLRHLLCYSISHGIPAIKINLSYLVEFLKSQNVSSISEDSLTGYVSSFCNEVIRCVVSQLGQQNCPPYIDDIIDEFKSINANMQVVIDVLNKFLQDSNQRCVLLIDEIEESYEKLKEMVVHETTPFRGVFDSVREGRSRIFPILAFGPSSIYSEAVSGAGAWRTIQHVLPIISPLNIKDVNKQVSDPYISNLIWWIGKGRPGHIDKIIDVGLHASAQNALNKCQSILKTNEAIRLQDVYAVANIPYIDYAAYSKIERNLDDEVKNLFYILSTLVGPIPETLLSNYKCINIDKIRYSKLPDYFVKSKYLIKVNDVISTLENILLKLDYKMGDFARDLISALFFAWSDHYRIILDKRALTELISIAKDLAIEFYQNDLYNALNKLDLNALYAELLNSKIESREFYYALSPLTLSSIYPPVLLMPFIGCSKNKSFDELYKILNELNINDIITISDSLQKEIINYASMRRIISSEVIQVMSNYKILFVPGKYVNDNEFISEVKRLLVSNDIHGVIIIPISYGQDPSLITNSLRSIWQKYEDLGLISYVFDLGARILLFLIGSLYNEYVRCDVKYEDNKELSMYGQFMNVIINLLQDAINSSLTKKNEKFQALMYNDNIRKLINELGNRGSIVGRGKGEYLLLLASSEHRDSLENYLETIIARKEKGALTLGIIDDVKQKFEALGEKLQSQGYKDIYGGIMENLTREFGMFLRNGWNYYMRIRDLWDHAYNDLQDKIDNLTDVLGDLYVSSSSYSNIRRKVVDLQELIEGKLNKITAKVINIGDEAIMNLITWRALQKHPDILAINDEKVIRECRKSENSIILPLNEALGILNDIIDLINKILSKTEKYVNESAGLISYLIELRNLINDIKDSLSKIRNYVEECGERIKGLNTAEQLWFLDFIIKDLITNLVNNASSVIKLVNSILSIDLNEVLKRLNSIEVNLEDLKGLINVNDEQSLLKNIMVMDYDTLMEYYRYDLRQILSNSYIIKELTSNLRDLEEAINDLKRAIKELNDSVQRKVEKVEKTINEIKGLVEG